MLRFLSGLSNDKKLILRDFGRKIGLEVKLNGVLSRDDLRLASFMKLFSIDIVLDVGANRGQFAQELFCAGYSGKIVSFEALPDAHRILSRNAEKKQGFWDVGPRVALSDKSGVAKFHVTDGDTSSSLFAPEKEFSLKTPQARTTATIDVPTARLDDVVKQMGISTKGCFLKMDVQGGEALVLAGASDTLNAAKGLMTELSLIPLYEGQPSAQALVQTIYEAGFEIWDIWQGYRDPKTHKLNQIDVVFFRSETDF